MKIIEFTSPTSVRVISDTALLIRQRPFFVPDFAEPCTAGLFLCWRISRLGRTIAPRFAHRYMDALTVCLRFRAEGLYQRLLSRGEPTDLAVGFDLSLAQGDLLTSVGPAAGLHRADAPALHEDQIHSYAPPTVTMEYQGQTHTTTTSLNPYLALSRASRFMTLRQGDLLLLATTAPRLQVSLDTQFHISLSGEELLHTRVK